MVNKSNAMLGQGCKLGRTGLRKGWKSLVDFFVTDHSSQHYSSAGRGLSFTYERDIQSEAPSMIWQVFLGASTEEINI